MGIPRRHLRRHLPRLFERIHIRLAQKIPFHIPCGHTDLPKGEHRCCRERRGIPLLLGLQEPGHIITVGRGPERSGIADVGTMGFQHAANARGDAIEILRGRVPPFPREEESLDGAPAALRPLKIGIIDERPVSPFSLKELPFGTLLSF